MRLLITRMVFGANRIKDCHYASCLLLTCCHANKSVSWLISPLLLTDNWWKCSCNQRLQHDLTSSSRILYTQSYIMGQFQKVCQGQNVYFAGTSLLSGGNVHLQGFICHGLLKCPQCLEMTVLQTKPEPGNHLYRTLLVKTYSKGSLIFSESAAFLSVPLSCPRADRKVQDSHGYRDSECRCGVVFMQHGNICHL